MRIINPLFRKPAPKRVSVTPGELSFDVPCGQTVLESALKLGIAYPHDCTVGTCGSCRSKLLSGRVEASTPFGYTLSRDELEAGYILACQALAKSDLMLEVDIAADPGGGAIVQPGALVSTENLTHDI